MDEMGFLVSQNLHNDAIRNIFYAPMSFFDTTVSTMLIFLRHFSHLTLHYSPQVVSLAFLERMSIVWSLSCLYCCSYDV